MNNSKCEICNKKAKKAIFPLMFKIGENHPKLLCQNCLDNYDCRYCKNTRKDRLWMGEKDWGRACPFCIGFKLP